MKRRLWVILSFQVPADSCSTDELMCAYRQSCEKNGVRPMAKLLQQLLVVSDFCDRNETLTLRGEHLELRHCETLEEILRRVQFRTLDLEATRLDEESAVALFDMIEYYESCTRLNISYNRNLGVRGWQSCARMLKKTPCLEHFEARGCTISEQLMPFIGRALRQGSSVTTLHLENAIISGKTLMILVAALKMNGTVRELFLADNKLMPSDGIQLGSLLKFNHRLQLLDVRNNHLQDVGISHLCDGLWEQNLDHGLNTLVLWNNQITYQSMTALSRALMNTRCLETLNLGHNSLTTEGIHRLKDGLLQNKSLLRIGLQASKINCEGAVALAEFIAESPRLVRLDLRENDIKTAGLMALSLSLKVSQSVTRIDLDKDPKKESSMKDYVEQQKRLLNDISNFMLRNRDLARQREEEEEKRRIADELALKQLQEAQTEEKKEEEEEEKEEQVDPNREPLGNLAVVDRDEKAERTEGSPSRNMKLDLSNPSLPACTLESPAFVPECQIPIVKATDENMTVIVEDKEAEALIATPSPVIPKEFPPSPMVSSNGHPILAPVLDPSLLHDTVQYSPNTKRKFLVSRVQEPKPKECWAEKGDASEQSVAPNGVRPELALAADVASSTEAKETKDKTEIETNKEEEIVEKTEEKAEEKDDFEKELEEMMAQVADLDPITATNSDDLSVEDIVE
ncbi:hypothetical protein CAPTEDRAFT_218827 [Capitella teleta]|uniref:Protein phosphatase 1 regulatory subunit 37 n=1 Tax=Capitella teleta TaxID=283909 RepID=R7U2G9_CAPTE|nr:hypothetical protein CAPTEDRAFT_218827 [Capitella teleta]|eukprot:ELT97355.1 hypothetical protein CAPTEDRAFT_218827 [Capitella teleta]